MYQHLLSYYSEVLLFILSIIEGADASAQIFSDLLEVGAGAALVATLEDGFVAVLVIPAVGSILIPIFHPPRLCAVVVCAVTRFVLLTVPYGHTVLQCETLLWLLFRCTQTCLTFTCVAKRVIAVVILAIRRGVTLPRTKIVLADTLLTLTLGHLFAVRGLMALPPCCVAQTIPTETVGWVLLAGAVRVLGALRPLVEGVSCRDTFTEITHTADI